MTSIYCHSIIIKCLKSHLIHILVGVIVFSTRPAQGNEQNIANPETILCKSNESEERYEGKRLINTVVAAIQYSQIKLECCSYNAN